MKYGLTETTVEKICAVFARFPEIEKAVLYGSRAKGNFKTGSDIDLTLCGEALTSDLCSTISSALDDLLLPYTIDLSVFNELNHDKLREHIERVGVLFYERANHGAAMKKGWKRKQIGDLCEVIAGQSPEGKFYNTDGKGMPFYQGKKDFGEKLIDAPTTWTTQTTKIARGGDILMSVRAPVGPVNFATDEVCIGRGLAAIRSRAELNRDFLFYQLLHLQPEIAGKEGAVFASINKSEIEALPIAFAPLLEQQRIVGILDEAFEGIATAKANTEKNLQNARALFESHRQSIFTKHGEGWVEKTVDQISTNLDSKRIPITKSDRTSGEFPYYGASGIVDYVADYIFEGDTLLVSEDGANLLARSTPIAFSVSGKYWVNNHAHILKFENMATQRFVEFYLESIKLDEYITGAAQPKLNQKALNSIPIPIPKSTDAQAQIVKSIELLSTKTRHLESIYQQKLAALEALKKSLLHQAFSGHL